MIRNILETIIKEETKDYEVAVMLSGGVDSISCALAAKNTGHLVHGYTFHMKGQPSYDSETAKGVCRIMGWECTTIELPLTDLNKNFFTLFGEYGCKKKAQFECLWPFMHVLPHVKEHEVIYGLGADLYYGTSKRVALHFKEPKELFDQFRTKYYDTRNSGSDILQMNMAKKFGKKIICPYYDIRVKDFFFAFDWYEVNKPKQKHHVRDAFPEFKKFGTIKPHVNLQLGAGIDKHFETLLSDKIINFRGRKRMMEVYRDWKNNQMLTFLQDYATITQ